MGCPVICEFAHHYPERIERAVLVSPAGGIHNQPLRRAMGQLAKDGGREPRKMIGVATPDYLRFGVPSTFKMFQALTQYPALQRLLELKVPTLVVLGTRDPLLPGPARIKEVAAQDENHVLLVVLEGAAHAINFSHPDELAHVIRLFMDDRPIVDNPGSPAPACTRSTAASTTRSPRTSARSRPDEALRQHDVLRAPLEQRSHLLGRVAGDPAADLGDQEAEFRMLARRRSRKRATPSRMVVQPAHRVDAVRLPCRPSP